MSTNNSNDNISSSQNVTKESLREMIKKRDSIEKEIDELIYQLQNTKVGLDGPLIDKQGFPRSDIDVNEIRSLRHKLACLKTDFETTTKQIELDMYEFHSTIKKKHLSKKASSENAESGSSNASDTSTSHSLPKTQENNPPKEQLHPFLIVNEVADDSPAQESGLKKGDVILKFGSITKSQVMEYGLKCLSAEVEKSLNKQLPVIVERGKKVVNLNFVPRSWSGNGYLGCHLLPLN